MLSAVILEEYFTSFLLSFTSFPQSKLFNPSFALEYKKQECPHQDFEICSNNAYVRHKVLKKFEPI
jgi:hypothetical protein